ncbi:Ig-like domain-containing protein, partial [Scandinavium sp. M-37]|uniref:Ig-like domain-containing protein n=1 Tax=Scandinavium sp. M-37 TaxID=3373077 RepID=UPI00374697D2
MSDSTEKQNDLTLAAVGAGSTSPVTIDSILDNTGQHQGPVAQYGETDDLQPTLTGSVPIGTSSSLIIRVYLNDEPIGTAHAQADGTWTYTLETPLDPDAQNYFQAVLLNPRDDSAPRFSDPYFINTTAPDQDVVAPDVPVIDSVADNVQGGITGDLANGSLTNDARPELTGHAMAGATVNIYDNDALIGTAIAGADGSWRFTPNTDLSEGAHNLSATAMNAAGESASTDGFALTVDTEVATPVLTAIVDNVGDYQ